MLVQSMPYPATPYLDGLDEFVSDNGATQPNLGPAIYPAALYDSGSDTTWMAWESWSGAARIPQVSGYDHSTGYYTNINAVGVTPLVDDDHGIPALCVDDEGHLHCFYGNHGWNQLHSSTQWAVDGSPGDGSMWAIRDPIIGEYTYPHPVPIGSGIHLFVRETVNPSSKMTLVLRKTATLVAGVATWDSSITLVDFGADSRFYMGTVVPNGTDIWIVAAKADFADSVRQNLYLFIYDTATGAIKNHDNSFSVASVSLPVTLSDANTNYRLFTHSGGNDDGGAPALCFDTNGDPHVLFKDGTGSSYAVKHITRSSGSWSSPVTIATVDNRYNCPVLCALASGWVEAWYPLDPGGSFTRFGNMVRRLRSPAGAWRAAQTIVEADVVGLGNPNAILNARSSARVMFSENLDDPADSGAGGLRTYIYGDGGLIAYGQAPEAATTPDTLQLNAENLQLNGEDLTLGV